MSSSSKEVEPKPGSDESESPVGWDEPACLEGGTVLGEKKNQAARLASSMGFFGSVL